MCDDITIAQLKENHIPSIKGIYKPYIFKKIRSSNGFKISLILSTIVLVYLLVSEVDHYGILIKIIDTNISIFPDLLGFLIGGYALIIGFGHKEMLQKMSSPNAQKDNMSNFQITSSIFATSVITMIITFLLSYIILFIINLELTSPNDLICKTINVFTTSLIFFFSIYSITLLYYMVVNIFNFGQKMHFCIREELKNKQNGIDKEN